MNECAHKFIDKIWVAINLGQLLLCSKLSSLLRLDTKTHFVVVFETIRRNRLACENVLVYTNLIAYFWSYTYF